MHRACTRGLFAGLALILVMGFTPLGDTRPVTSVVVPAKVGFSYLSSAQLQQLWRLTGEYALAEVFLKQCGSPSYIERRMHLAARDCVEAEALNRVARYFRKKMAELGTKYVFICDSDQSKELIRSTRAKIDAAVAEVRSMCRACLFC
jgi:hypothetical protein